MTVNHAWLVAAIWTIALIAPSAARALGGGLVDRLVALELVSMEGAVAMVMLAEAYSRLPLYDVALALALLSFASGLVFVRFLEHWF
jgi:multicomponent Na+:H+ antiporter subunit F